MWLYSTNVLYLGILSLNILLIEDDDVAVDAVLRHIKKKKMLFNVIEAEEGQTALDILRGESPNQSIAAPFVVLLDINMVGMNGFEFLANVRADPKLRATIIFVLSSSEEEVDIKKAYFYNVAGYIVKNQTEGEVERLLDFLAHYQDMMKLPVNNLLNG